MTTLTHADLRTLGYCNRGARDFCLRHGVNWRLFVQQGVDAAQLEHIDDAMLQDVIRQAERREQEGTK